MAIPDWVIQQAMDQGYAQNMSVDPGMSDAGMSVAPAQAAPGGIPDDVRAAIQQQYGTQPAAVSQMSPAPSPGIPPDVQAAIVSNLGSNAPVQINPFGRQTAQNQAAQASAAAPQPQAPQYQGPGPLGELALSYLRGNQSVSPERIAKAGEQWQQRGFGAMPGDDATLIPNRYLPGVDDPTPEQMAMIKQRKGESPEAFRARQTAIRDAIANQNAQARQHNVDPSQFDKAQQQRQEAENETLIDQRLALQSAADRQEQIARNEYLRGRGYAEEIVRAQNEREQRNAEIDRILSEQDKLIDRASKLTAVNPTEQYWSNMSGFSRAATALSLGLGALGQALAGGQNVALELVHRGIDGEVQKQRAQIEMLGPQLAAKRSALGALMMKFRDPNAAEAALRSAMMGQLESEYRRQAAQEKSAELQNQQLQMADNLAIERAKQKEQALGAERTALYAWQPKRVVGNAGGIAGAKRYLRDLGYKEGTPEYRDAMNSLIRDPAGFDPRATPGANMSEDQVRQAKFDLEHRITLPDGSQGYVNNKGETEKSISSVDNMNKSFNQLEKYLYQGSAWSPTDRANVEALSNMMMGEVRVMLGLGVMSESDKELAKSLTGEFVNDRLAVSDKAARLNALRGLVSQRMDGYLRNVYTDPNARQPVRKTIKEHKL